jgi:hypothetical protein
MNRGLAVRIFDLLAGIGGLVASIVCGKGREVLVSHVSDGNWTGTRFVIVGTMGFGSTRAGGRDDVTVVQMTIVVVVVVVVVVVKRGHGEYGGGGGVWFGEL